MINEKELFDLKWFDYRAISPHAATLICLKEYVKRTVSQNADLGKFPVVLRAYSGFDKISLCRMKRWKYLIRIRQFADKHGMPYAKFWEFAVKEHHDRRLRLYNEYAFTNEKILRETARKWRWYREEFIVYSDFYLLHPTNYRGYPFQDDYYSYLVGRLKRRHPRQDLEDNIQKLIEWERMPVEFLRKIKL